MAETVALIPAHNEALTVRQVVDATVPFVDKVIVIDDGSTDDTSGCLADSDCKVIRHEQNRGKGTRLVEGLDYALNIGADVVIVLDADQQHDPTDIPSFINAHLKDPTAFILGDRSGDMKQMPSHRRRSIKFGNFFIGWACNKSIQDAQCGMRAYPCSMWQQLKIPVRHTHGFKFETAALMYAAKLGTEFSYVPIKARYDGYVLRPSHFDPMRDFSRLFGLVTEFLLSNRLCIPGLMRAIGLKKEQTKE